MRQPASWWTCRSTPRRRPRSGAASACQSRLDPSLTAISQDRKRMRVLITGSSGQIGTNLGLRLLEDGHDVFGVDKRQNSWTDAFPTLLQDLAGHYPAFKGGIGGVEYPGVDLVVHLAAHAKV